MNLMFFCVLSFCFFLILFVCLFFIVVGALVSLLSLFGIVVDRVDAVGGAAAILW